MSSDYKKPSQRDKVRTSVLDSGMGKLPPQALDLEEVVIGGMLLEPNAVNTVAAILTPDSFYKEAHAVVYKAVLNLHDKRNPVDLMTVNEQLKKNGELEIAGGTYALVLLTNKVSSAANIEYHSRIIAQKHMQREMIHACSLTIAQAYDNQTDVFEMIAGHEKDLTMITTKLQKKDVQQIKSSVNEVMNKLNAPKKSITGVPSGIEELDKLTGGFQDSDLVIIAARPGMGKTALVASILKHATSKYDMPVAFFSLEMSTDQNTTRIIAMESGVASNRISRNWVTDGEKERVEQAAYRISKYKMFVDDTAALTLREFKSKLYKLKREHDIKLAAIDYLQLMEGEGNNREAVISAISRGLKQVAKELQIPIIALSQLSRTSEKRGLAARPMLSDLRESGAIEQDADIVIFLYRPEYYNPGGHDESGNSLQGVAEIIIAKHRNGDLATVEAKFHGPTTLFSNPTDEQPTEDAIKEYTHEEDPF